MARHVHFYAAGSDLLPVLAEVEAKQRIVYVPMDPIVNPEGAPIPERYTHGADLPDLGRATDASASSCHGYLVTHERQVVTPRRITSDDGTIWYAIDQLANPDTVEFSPGGVWTDEIVLYGRAATVSDTKPAQRLMRLFRNAIKRHFVRIRAFWIGPEAESLLDAGKRLTPAAQCPPEMDLARE